MGGCLRMCGEVGDPNTPRQDSKGYWDHLPPHPTPRACKQSTPRGDSKGYLDHLPPNWDWGIGITYLPTGKVNLSI